MNLETALRQYFHFSHFRPGQREIIANVLAQQDTLAILPTGGGKSLCYQIPGLVLSGVTLVISPLISLMKDQVDQLRKRGIEAAFINSTLSELEVRDFFTKFTERKFQFVYVAPERLLTQQFITACQQSEIALLAIDEAHCVSQWGHDFRPAYLQIPAFVSQLSWRPPLIALTATATPEIREEIITFLRLHQPQIFVQSFQRPNLAICCLNVEQEADKMIWLQRLWQEFAGQKVLIYCATRAQTGHYAQLAKYFGYPCAAYHAGLESDERSRIQQQFTDGHLKMVAATNAFGMGVDLPDIRLVMHVQIPTDLESYYQEIGRAGRDGLPARCYLLYQPHDEEIQTNLFARRFPSPTLLRSILRRVAQAQLKHQTLTLKILEEEILLTSTIPDRHQARLDLFHGIHILESLGYLPTCNRSSTSPLTLLNQDPSQFHAWEQQRARAIQRRESVSHFLRTPNCRMMSITQYFGEQTMARCTHCDICQPSATTISQRELRERQHYRQLFQRPPQTKLAPFSRFSWTISQHTVKYLALKSLHSIEVKDTFYHIPGVGLGCQKYWENVLSPGLKTDTVHLE